MSTRIQQAETITDPQFLLQVQGSLYSAAAQILNEADTTADHANRLAFARAIFGNCALQAQFMAPGFLTNATIAGAAGGAAGSSGTPFADSDIDYVVASLFNTYADAYASQNPGAVPALGS